MQKIVRILTGLAICASASAYAMGEAPAYFKPGFVLGVDGGYGFLNTPDQIYPKDFLLTYNNMTPALFGVGKVTPIPPIQVKPSSIEYNAHDNNGSFVWGVHAGYDWQTGKSSLVGLELGYKDLGEAKYKAELQGHIGGGSTLEHFFDVNASRKINEQALDLLLTYHYFVYHGFNVFAKAGIADIYAQTQQDVDAGMGIGGSGTSTRSGDIEPSGGFVYLHNIPALDGSMHIWRFEPEMQVGAGYMFAQHVNVYAYYDHIGDSAPSVWDHLSQAKAYGVNSLWAGVSYTF
jgi:hypothetical protein